MEPFLDKLAKHLLKTHGENFSRLCLVFPSRRASLFFKQYVSAIIKKPIWLPDIYALEDFVVHKSGLKLSDPLELISRLYKVYKSIEKEKAQSFSEFISWGNMLLGDFDEIDQYLADGEKVFRYLDEIKALKYWNLDGKPLTSFELNYLHFYNSLAPCYTQFRAKLLENGEAYFGLAFDILLKGIESKSFEEWDSIVFAGFNALTAAEEKLFTHLLRTNKAEIYWDADDYYLSDSRQEAGRFLREYNRKNTFGPVNWIGNSLGNDEKTIHVVGVPGNVGQAKLAGELIKEVIRKKGTSNGVALVLVDEGLLLPVLNSIPSDTGDFNVTMGFPLKQTPVFSLLNIVISMFANAKRFAQPVKDAHNNEYLQPRFYYKDIQRFLSHPFIVKAQINSSASFENSGKQLVLRSFYNAEDFAILLGGINNELSAVFEPSVTKKQIEASDVLSVIRSLVSFLKNTFAQEAETGNGQPNNTISIKLEYLFHAAQLCTKLDSIVNDTELKPDIETMQTLVSNLIAGMRLPFYGEPLNGLQVMGMLETRMLDFTDIVMLSVNEGLLPKGKSQNTFIPDEVRNQFGMQRYSERTAVFAYHFYRLMQKVENAWLIYNTEGDEMGGGEKSRFISQLMYELPLVNPAFKISEQTLSVVPGSTNAGEISIDKTPEILTRLRQLAERGLSPTALSMYLKCKLQFYFSQVLRISEPDQVSETIDAATLGEIVHEALHQTYQSKKNAKITPELMLSMLPEASRQVQIAFTSKFNTQELSTGKNLLIVKVAENMVKRFLLAEKKYLEQAGGTIEIVMLEEELDSVIEIADSQSGEIIGVKIHGKADRIDRVGGKTRIIDYKTGNVEAKELKLDQISDFSEKENPGKLLQVLMYALMYNDMHKNQHQGLISGIISLRKTSAYLLKTQINQSDSIDTSLIEAFRGELKTIIGSIYSTDEPFDQTEDRDTCHLCAFNTICNRTVD